MVYATSQDYESFSGNTAPDNIEKLLNKASITIDRLTLNRIDLGNELHTEAAKNAVCAQVDYWLGIDEELIEFGNVSSFNIGNFSMNFGDGDHSFNKLANDAYDYLFNAGLLYRGVKAK